MTRSRFHKQGYSLVELMLVILIIGILSSIVAQRYSRHKTEVLVKGEVFSVLSPWIKVCRGGFGCRPCAGHSHYFDIEPWNAPNRCRFTAIRNSPNMSIGDYVEIRMNRTGYPSYHGSLSIYAK